MSKQQLKVVGNSIHLMEAYDKVTGKATYADDMQAEVFVKILGSPHAHGKRFRSDAEPILPLSWHRIILDVEYAGVLSKFRLALFDGSLQRVHGTRWRQQLEFDRCTTRPE